MARPAMLLRKSLIFVHRWLGVALSAIFLMWFVSGIVMMYWDYPSVGADDRLERSAPLADVHLNPRQAFERLHASQLPSQVRLNMFDGRPVYRFRFGREEALVYADDGGELSLDGEVTEATIGRIAAAWARQPLAGAIKEVVEEVDQWTLGVRRQLPLRKYSWPDGQQVYVAGDTGEVVQYTTRALRFWAYLGAIPHWMYFTPLRKHGEEWSRVVIWTSGAGTLACVLGIAIGIWMFSPRRRYGNAGSPTGIPYRGQKRWHMVLGLLFGLAAATWAFSGLLSMEPFPVQGQRGPRGPDIAGALRGASRVDPASYEEMPPVQSKEVELIAFDGEPVYLAKDGPRGSRLVPLRGEPVAAFDANRIIEIVRRAAGANLAEARVMDEYDAYYLDRTGRRPLPVVYVRLNDAGGTRYYIDPKTARVAGSYSTRGWVNRWLYHGLHSLDFPWLYKYRPLWDIVVISLLLGGAALCVTSLILAWRVVKRKVAARFAVSEDLVAEAR